MARQAKRQDSAYVDVFSDFLRVRGKRAVALRQSFPRVVTRPDVRVNRLDPTQYKYKGKVCGHGWFPFVLKLASGDLLCLYSEASAHVYCPGGRTVASRSIDGGRTWGPAQVLYHKKDWICHPGYGQVQTSDGRIWVSIRAQFFDAKKGTANDPRAWRKHNVILASDDNGHTWREMAMDHAELHPRPVFEMSNGRVIWTLRCVDERGDSFRGTALHTEKDGKLLFEIREHPELGPTADEWTIVETRRPGELVCMMRQQQHTQFFATAKSDDYGVSWAPWRESNVFMGPFPTRPQLRRADDGTLLFCYGQRWIGRTFVVPSHDNGDTWDIARRQTILHSPREYHKVWDSHYTDVAPAEGTKWVAVDYVASPRKETQKGIYGTFIDARYFREAHEGVTLAPVGGEGGDDLVGQWGFDELEGDFARDPVAANFGEIRKAKRAPGKVGGALDCDGKRSYCVVYDDATLRMPKYFTLAAWIKVRDAKRDQTILSKAPKYALCLRDGKLALAIGKAVMVSESGTVPSNRWVHVAVTFGMRRMYSRATFYINGKEDSWVQPQPPRADTFADAMAYSDTPITGGPLFQEFGHKNKSADNLVIGMDNNLRTGAFDGLIDEVAIYASDLSPERIRRHMDRRYRPDGEVVSLRIARPAGAKWGSFHAATTTPARTKIAFTIEDDAGKTLVRNAADGADLAKIDADRIVLRATLSTTDPGQTPILHSWSVSCEGGAAPNVVWPPFPDQTAALASKGGKVKSGVVL